MLFICRIRSGKICFGQDTRMQEYCWPVTRSTALRGRSTSPGGMEALCARFDSIGRNFAADGVFPLGTLAACDRAERVHLPGIRGSGCAGNWGACFGSGAAEEEYITATAYKRHRAYASL